MTCGLVVHCARATRVHVGSPLTLRYFEQATWKLVYRQSSMSVIQWRMTEMVECIVRVHTCNFERRFPPENKFNIELKHSYDIYDFGPRQCNQAVPASSPKS